MSNTIVSLFNSTNDAKNVVQELTQAGFNGSDIKTIGSNDRSASKDIINTLTSVSVPQVAAQVYDEGIRDGGTLVTLRVEDDKVDRAMDIIARHNAVDIDERLSKTQTTTSTDVNRATSDRAEAAIPVIEEELQVGKRQVQRGGVRVYTNVTERPVEEQVRLREEHVKVERRPVDRPVSDADMAALKGGAIEVTTTAEEAVVSKQARVVEEVVVGKEVQERTETVRDTVRRTDVEVDEVSTDRTKSAKK
jgi:uncharacterized protein (TIGR02271 family)